jgi:hypothetical protein
VEKVQDLIDEQDDIKAHTHRFYLWPKLWLEYIPKYAISFNWQVYSLRLDQVRRIPEKPGIYTLIIQPGIALHPHCSYLAYVGKTDRTLRERFKEYLNEKKRVTGRPKLLGLLNKYDKYVYFCCTEVRDQSLIAQIEDDLIGASECVNGFETPRYSNLVCQLSL